MSLYLLLLDFQSLKVESFIKVGHFLHSFCRALHVALVVRAHCNFQFYFVYLLVGLGEDDLRSGFVELDFLDFTEGLFVALVGEFVLLHLLVRVTKELLADRHLEKDL